MDYKEKIIDLLGKVQKEGTLKRVYKLLQYLYLREDYKGLKRIINLTFRQESINYIYGQKIIRAA